jgi:hypothetical protein
MVRPARLEWRLSATLVPLLDGDAAIALLRVARA